MMDTGRQVSIAAEPVYLTWGHDVSIVAPVLAPKAMGIKR